MKSGEPLRVHCVSFAGVWGQSIDIILPERLIDNRGFWRVLHQYPAARSAVLDARYLLSIRHKRSIPAKHVWIDHWDELIYWRALFASDGRPNKHLNRTLDAVEYPQIQARLPLLAYFPLYRSIIDPWELGFYLYSLYALGASDNEKQDIDRMGYQMNVRAYQFRIRCFPHFRAFQFAQRAVIKELIQHLIQPSPPLNDDSLNTGNGFAAIHYVTKDLHRVCNIMKKKTSDDLKTLLKQAVRRYRRENRQDEQ
jgi:hypothetical protein